MKLMKVRVLVFERERETSTGFKGLTTTIDGF